MSHLRTTHSRTVLAVGIGLLACAAAAACSSSAGGPDNGARSGTSSTQAPAPSGAASAPTSARPVYEPAFVEGTPGASCQLHPEGSTDASESVPVTIDADGVARINVVRPASPGATDQLALDCAEPSGAAVTYPVDLRADATFAPHPFDAVRANLELRPALVGDPLSYSESELIRRGYGLRPDPASNPTGYAHWLKAARIDAHKLPAVPRTFPSRGAARSPRASAPGMHAEASSTVITQEYPGWTGAIQTGSYSVGATAAQSTVYAANYAWWAVPAVTLNAFGISGTKISMWNGIGESAGQLVQNEVWMVSSSTATSYALGWQVFSAAGVTQNGTAGKGTQFTPSPGDEIYSEVWYCDASGNVNPSGGYACLTMLDNTSALTWICTSANSPTCSSYLLNTSDTFNGNVGTTAEYVIENDGDELAGGTQGYWPDFTAPLNMSGAALVMTGTTSLGWINVSTDPYVLVLEDFAPASNPDHMGIALQAPESTIFTVTQRAPAAPQTAPSCTYSASDQGYVDAANVSIHCTPDASKDPISVFQSLNGVWQSVTTLPSGSSAGSITMTEAAGDDITFLACAAPTSPDTWPVAPGDIGCDSVATTVCVSLVCPAGACGQIGTSNGCGGTTPIECATCPSGDVCSSNHCCPSGDAWSAADNECVLSCPTGTSVCDATGTCLTTIACKSATGGGCRKVGNIVECN